LILEPIVRPGFTPAETVNLTATMGNYMRVRELWLKDGPVRSRELWPDYRGEHFAPDRTFPMETMQSYGDGTRFVAFTTDEADPAAVTPAIPSWRYAGLKRTQYWRCDPAKCRNVYVRTNGRFVYWQSKTPIPGGITFENIDLMATYEPGQWFAFGITSQSPGKIGK
jgi:hypothetical protein